MEDVDEFKTKLFGNGVVFMTVMMGSHISPIRILHGITYNSIVLSL